MDLTALFKLTYGMFVVSAKEGDKLNGCIVNTFAQVASNPARASVTINKDCLTHDMINRTDKFAVSVLPEDTPIKLIASFGFRSGRDVEKFDGFNYAFDIQGLPYLEKDPVAFISCKVFNKVDVGTHTTFFADIVYCKKLSDKEPMTYAYYHKVKNGKASKNSPLSHES